MTKPLPREVAPERLRLEFDSTKLDFDCTDQISPLTDFVGQDRARSALEFGLGMHRAGYNIFVTGMTGTGKVSAILDYIQRQVKKRNDEYVVRDWCYVYNFDDPDQPRALSLPRGAGRKLRDSLEQLLLLIRANLTTVFTSEDYERQRRTVLEEGQRRGSALIEEAQNRAAQAGFDLNFMPTGPVIIPLREGRPMTPQEYEALTIEERRAIAEKQTPVNQVVADVGEGMRAVEREVATAVTQMDRQVVAVVVEGPFAALIAEHKNHPDTADFLEDLRAFTLKNADFLRQLAGQPAPANEAAPPGGPPDPFAAFRINVLVDNSSTEGPPIIVEANPTWTNLFGRIDRRAFMGTYISDHTMLKPGAAHRANGGYLILNFNDVATKPGAWDALKRLIRTRQVRIEDPLEQSGLITPQTLRPSPIPAEVKLIVAGDAMSYIMLSSYDEEFWELFKVKADFDYQIPRTQDNIVAYAGFIRAVCERESLRHFEAPAIGQLVEYGSRAVEDQEKLSARFGRLRDIIIEADYWAGRDKKQRVAGKHVDRAIDQRVYRSNLIEERLQEMIARGTLMIDVQGAVVGQVNGLAVLDFGDVRFGRPMRITARTYLGQRGVLSIDRESQLSGKIHDKGVLILSGFLGWKYGQERPLSLSATISFEQGYDLIEGDSASLGETCAVLSALADVPVRQDIAITGSVNQKGEVQPIGGAIYKIEGFFDVCKSMGLTGKQGVIVPSRNVKNLMLREDVVAATRRKKFHVYEVDSVDEALEALTGITAGERQPDGTYPEGTIHARVQARLHSMGDALRQSAPTSRGPDQKGEPQEEDEEKPSEPPELPPRDGPPKKPPKGPRP